MPKQFNKNTPEPACEFIACEDCGLYRLCHLASDGEDPSLSKTMIKRRFVLRRGEYLYRQGDSFHAIYAIRLGTTKTYIINEDGRTQITRFHGPGELIGLDAIEAGHFDSEAIALETTSFCEIPFSHFQELSRQFPDLQHQMLAVMSHAILRGQQMMLLLGKKDATEKLATYLLSLCQHPDKDASPPPPYKLSMSRGDLGNHLGLTQETICRILTRFQEDGIISIQNKTIHFLDNGRLRALTSKIRAGRDHPEGIRQYPLPATPQRAYPLNDIALPLPPQPNHEDASD
jgi:CRP/FNR family transcriptional regulator